MTGQTRKYTTFITINSPWSEFGFTHCPVEMLVCEVCVRNFHLRTLPVSSHRFAFNLHPTPSWVQQLPALCHSASDQTWTEAPFLWPITGPLPNRVSVNANINSCMYRVLKCSHFGSLGSVLKADCLFYWSVSFAATHKSTLNTSSPGPIKTLTLITSATCNHYYRLVVGELGAVGVCMLDSGPHVHPSDSPKLTEIKEFDMA